MRFPSSVPLGLLVLRLGLGVMFILHGLPKLLPGPARWEAVGQMGLPFLPDGILAQAAGLLAAVIETAGGVLLATGIWHRITCFALATVMAVAFLSRLGGVEGWQNFAVQAGWPLEILIVMVGLGVAGSGPYRLGRRGA